MTATRTMAMAGVGVLMLVSGLSAQRRVAPGAQAQRPTVRVTIALKAGGDTYQAGGEGRCTHAPKASVYGLVAEQWVVEHSEGGRSAHLTVWKPANGSEMFSLSVSTGKGSQTVNTVKANGAPPVKGSGTLSFAPSGKGGAFTVDAKTANGTPITGTLTCDGFLPASAEGGD